MADVIAYKSVGKERCSLLIPELFASKLWSSEMELKRGGGSHATSNGEILLNQALIESSKELSLYFVVDLYHQKANKRKGYSQTHVIYSELECGRR